jgi:hypothetical protein
MHDYCERCGREIFGSIWGVKTFWHDRPMWLRALFRYPAVWRIYHLRCAAEAQGVECWDDEPVPEPRWTQEVSAS